MAMKGTRISKPNVKISMMISVVPAIAEKKDLFFAHTILFYISKCNKNMSDKVTDTSDQIIGRSQNITNRVKY